MLSTVIHIGDVDAFSKAIDNHSDGIESLHATSSAARYSQRSASHHGSGINKTDIFADDQDKARFLELLVKPSQKGNAQSRPGRACKDFCVNGLSV